MKKIRQYRIRIIFILATILLLALSVFSYWRIINLLDTSALVNHTTIVKLQLENIFSIHMDADSEHRGFVLTKDTLFTKKYRQSIKKLNTEVERLNRMTADNYSQQQNLIVLKQLLANRIGFMEGVIRDSPSRKIEMERWLSGRAMTDELRKHTDKMMAEEDLLLRMRSKSLTEETALTPLFTTFLMICALLVLIVSYIVITRELKISNLLKSDLEDRKKLLIANNISLSEKNESLAKMNKELESFTYISSHDLQEPLRKIQTFVSRILDKEYDSLSESGKSYLTRTQDSAFRMQNLIQDLLAYSRLKTEVFPLVETNLKALVSEVEEDLSEEIAFRNAAITVSGSATVKVIVSQFRQLLTNLISNSVKFSKTGTAPKITIDCTLVKGFETGIPDLQPNQKYSKMVLSDNGIGFNAEYSERIFEVFQRLHTDQDYIGTGIGLAIVKKIVENHNGYISADSTENQGATFTIYIPF